MKFFRYIFLFLLSTVFVYARLIPEMTKPDSKKTLYYSYSANKQNQKRSNTQVILSHVTLENSFFPSSGKALFSVDVYLFQSEYLYFELVDVYRKLVTVLLRDWVKTKDITFNFSLQGVTDGIYLLKIIGNQTTAIWL